MFVRCHFPCDLASSNHLVYVRDRLCRRVVPTNIASCNECQHRWMRVQNFVEPRLRGGVLPKVSVFIIAEGAVTIPVPHARCEILAPASHWPIRMTGKLRTRGDLRKI